MKRFYLGMNYNGGGIDGKIVYFDEKANAVGLLDEGEFHWGFRTHRYKNEAHIDADTVIAVCTHEDITGHKDGH